MEWSDPARVQTFKEGLTRFLAIDEIKVLDFHFQKVRPYWNCPARMELVVAEWSALLCQRGQYTSLDKMQITQPRDASKSPISAEVWVAAARQVIAGFANLLRINPDMVR